MCKWVNYMYSTQVLMTTISYQLSAKVSACSKAKKTQNTKPVSRLPTRPMAILLSDTTLQLCPTSVIPLSTEAPANHLYRACH